MAPRLDHYLAVHAESRPRVIAALDGFAKTVPGDDWIAGHRVGMRIKQGWIEEAVEVAGACAATRWWCDALLGLSLHVAGRIKGRPILVGKGGHPGRVGAEMGCPGFACPGDFRCTRPRRIHSGTSCWMIWGCPGSTGTPSSSPKAEVHLVQPLRRSPGRAGTLRFVFQAASQGQVGAPGRS